MVEGSEGRRGTRVVLALLLSALMVSGFVGIRTDARAGARLEYRRQMLGLTNEARERRDRRDLALARVMSRYATSHSSAMANAGHIFHSTDAQLLNLLDGMSWSIAGENVGSADSLTQMQRAFMNSAPHRENILRRAYDHAAVGVVRDAHGRYWVTVIFYG